MHKDYILNTQLWQASVMEMFIHNARQTLVHDARQGQAMCMLQEILNVHAHLHEFMYASPRVRVN